jgi:hypothetical protein
MVKHHVGSKDGWYSSNPFLFSSLPETIDKKLDKYEHPNYSGFGQYDCKRCHASAAAEMTFSEMKNIAGFRGEPLRFRNDNSWRSDGYRQNLEKQNLWKAIEKARDEVGVSAQFPIPDQQTPLVEAGPVRDFIALPGAGVDLKSPDARSGRNGTVARSGIPERLQGSFPLEPETLSL